MSEPLYLYIHGFNSSPQSFKARQLVRWMADLGQADRLLVPSLPYQPDVAIRLLIQQVTEHSDRPLVLLGSSLGGFYATWLTEHFGTERDIRTVLINPAIRPFDLLDEWLGENENYYTHEKYLLNRDHLAQLKALECPRLRDYSRYLLLTQTGDEVLDYQQGVDKYIDSPQRVIAGGDHGFQHFDAYWSTIFEFSGDAELQRQAQTLCE